MCLPPLSSPGAVAPGSANPKASILASGPVVRTPRWAFLGLTLLRIGPLSSQLERAAAIALRPCWWTAQLLGELDLHLLRWLPLLLVPQFARAVRCCMSAPNQSLPSLPVPLAPQTLLGLPGLARLPLHPVGPPGSHLCVETSSWTTHWTEACPAVVVGPVGGTCCLLLKFQDPFPAETGSLPCSQVLHPYMQLMVAAPSSAARTPTAVPSVPSPVACPQKPWRVWKCIQTHCSGCPHPLGYLQLVSEVATRTLPWRGCGTGTSGTRDWPLVPSVGQCSPTWGQHTHPSSMPAAMRWASHCMALPARHRSRTPGVLQRPLSLAGMGVLLLMGRGMATDAEGILTREHFVTIADEWDHKKMSCSLGMGLLSDITFISPWGPDEEDLGCW